MATVPSRAARGRDQESDASVALLREHGAPEGEAQAIVRCLLRAGLTGRMVRDWLANSRRGYPVRTGTRLSDEVFWDQIATHAVEDGHTRAVLASAREFSSASLDERTISWLLACRIESVRWLTAGVAERAAVIAEFLRSLLADLGTEARVQNIVALRARGDRRHTTLIERIRDGEELRLLDELRDGQLDLATLAANGMHMPWGP